MGLRSAVMACQRITTAVCSIFEAEGQTTLSYLDDFIGVASLQLAKDTNITVLFSKNSVWRSLHTKLALP